MVYYARAIFDEIWMVWYVCLPRVLYDRVRKKKINFEITAFLNYERGLQEREIQNQMKTIRTTFFVFI